MRSNAQEEGTRTAPQKSAKSPFARDSEVELVIEKFADKGKSLARVDGYVIFISGAVPGDRVRARILKKKRSYAEAALVQILEPSPQRVKPPCQYFGTCGGCSWQHVAYESQLEAKKQSVEEALVHHGGLAGVEVQPVLGADPNYHYRNKMEFSFSSHRWFTPEEISSGKPLDRHFALGLHVPGNYYKVLDLQECHLQSETSVAIVNGVRHFVQERNWKPWNIRTHKGFLRHLVLRQSHALPELMVNLVTSRHDLARMNELAAYLNAEHPSVTTLVNTVNTSVAQTAFGEAVHTIFGPGVIHDMIGPYRFTLSPNAFFQTNTRQAQQLYETVLAMVLPKPESLVFDLYCGTGTISLFVAPHVRHVVGVELVAEAVENAKCNAQTNSIENCTFISGDMLRTFTPAFVTEYGKPDVLIVDPPRAGMHRKVVGQIASLRPERIVYVSCNPLSQARDVAMLKEDYNITAVQPVDMFPHTHHIENIICLQAKPI